MPVYNSVICHARLCAYLRVHHAVETQPQKTRVALVAQLLVSQCERKGVCQCLHLICIGGCAKSCGLVVQPAAVRGRMPMKTRQGRARNRAQTNLHRRVTGDGTMFWVWAGEGVRSEQANYAASEGCRAVLAARDTQQRSRCDDARGRRLMKKKNEGRVMKTSEWRRFLLHGGSWCTLAPEEQCVWLQWGRSSGRTTATTST